MTKALRKEREFHQREREILEAALDLFDHTQWDKITVAQIAKHAGIGKGTVYKHFASKEDIYARLAMEDAEQMLHDLQGFLGRGRGLDQLRKLLEYCFECHLRSPVTDSLHMYCKQLNIRGRISPEYQQGIKQTDEAFMTLFTQPIVQGIEEGDIADLPLETLFAGMHATFEGALQMLRNKEFSQHELNGNPVSADEFIGMTVDYMMAALAGMPSRQELGQ
jgi:AcrR family transcriptional regulator